MGPGRFRHVIHETCREEMPSVEVAAAVVQLQICRVIQDGGTILADLIQSMGPGIAERRAQSMPRPEPETGLERVVLGSADTVHLQDVAEVRERTALIDIGDDV